MSRARQRRQRRRIFLGCEGDSERSYGTLLHQLIHADGRLHIETVVLQPGGGDPLAIVENAAAVIRRKERDFGKYFVRAILLDRDKYGINNQRDQKIPTIIGSLGIHLVWQRPCHEALLLRHIAGCHSLQPPTTADAIARLQVEWPNYEKGGSSAYLAGKIDLDAVRRVIAVEADLATFLKIIGYFK